VFQELALYGEFSIRETLRYFGRIYGMDSSDVELKGKFIISLLDLPSDSSRLVRNLRYVSLRLQNKVKELIEEFILQLG
jgi:ABC-type multidrug transport system ATPase subunit